MTYSKKPNAPKHAALMAGVAVFLFALPLAAQDGAPVDVGPPNVPDFSPAFPQQTRAPERRSGIDLVAETIAGGLEHPWGLAVLPEGGYLVTERPGRMRHVAADGTLSPPLTGLPDVYAQRQGGLLDVALGDDYAENRTIFWTYAKPGDDGLSATAASRGTLSEDFKSVTEVTEIFVQFPGASVPAHYGSRVLPDGQGHVFVTTGERFTPALSAFAQDLDKTYGKVVRLSPTGDIPEDNPFIGQTDAIPSIWSYGHRNVQGAALHPDTRTLWTIEHGPQGGDELNLIEPGENYGWPVISYGETYSGSPVGAGITAKAGMAQPRYYWDPVIAPGDLVFYQGDMFPDWQGDILIAALRGGLVRLELDGKTVVAEERLMEDLGRVRDVDVDSDGSLLVLTDQSNGALIRLTAR